MSYPRAHPGVLRRNMLLSITLMLAIGVIASTLWLQANEINLNRSSAVLGTIEAVLFSLFFLFNTILFGTLAEYYRREPNLLIIGLSTIFPLLLALGLGVYEYERVTYGILGGMGVVVAYLFLSSSPSQ